MTSKRTRYGGGWDYETVQSQHCSAECVNPNSQWIQCDGCDEWKHVTCIGLTVEKAEALPEYYCRQCKKGRKTPSKTVPGQGAKLSRVPNNVRELETVERAESRVDTPVESDDLLFDIEPVTHSSPKNHTTKQRCPCGKHLNTNFCVKCYECTQVFHASCVGIDDNKLPRQFTCDDCEDRLVRQERDELYARLEALREDRDQTSLLDMNTEELEYAQFAKKLTGRETFNFSSDTTDIFEVETVEDAFRTSSPLSTKPLPVPRKSVLRKKENAEPRIKERSAAEPDPITQSEADRNSFADRDRMQKGQRMAAENPATGYERLSGNQPQFARGDPAKEDAVGESADKEDGRAADALAHTGRKRVGFTDRVDERRTSAYSSREGGRQNSSRHLMPSGQQRGDRGSSSYKPLLSEFEGVVVDKHLEETLHYLQNLEHERYVTKMRALSLAKERERIRSFGAFRPTHSRSGDDSPQVLGEPVRRKPQKLRGNSLYKAHGPQFYETDSEEESPYSVYKQKCIPRVRIASVPSRDVHSGPFITEAESTDSRRSMTDNVQQQVGALSLNSSKGSKHQDNEKNPKGPPPPKPTDPNMEIGRAVLSLAEQMAQLHAANRYTTGLATMKVLNGTEGPEGIRRYFRQFDMLTRDWSSEEKLDALSVKLEGKAFLVLSSMPSGMQSDYDSVKAELLERLANEEPKRVRRLGDLMSGKPRKPGEPISAFGERVLQLVRDACDADCPASQVDELCKAYFVNWINDRELIPSLTEKRESMQFHRLVDHAAALRASLDQYKKQVSDVNPAQSYAPQQNQMFTSAPPPPPVRRDAPQKFNPNRMPLRYQGQFPPPRNNFAAPRAHAPATNSAVEVNQPSVTNTGESGATASAVPNEEANMMHMWQSTDDTYFDPFQVNENDCLRRRRRQKKSVSFDSAATSVMLNVPRSPRDARGTATATTLTADVKPRSLGPTCTTIVRIRGMPCEALVDSGSRVSLAEAGYLKGLLLKSGAKLEDVEAHKSTIPAIVCANKSTLSAAAAMTVGISYGGHSAQVELQVSTEKLAFPLILGTNCLSELGFELTNRYTGEELLSTVDLENESDECVTLPAVDVCAANSVIIPPYGSAAIQARIDSDGCSSTYCVSPCVASAARSDALVKTETGNTCFWLINKDASPINVEEGQVVGKADVVDEVYSSSDILATDALEELIAQADSPAFLAAVTADQRHVTADPRERFRILLELIGGPEVELSAKQVAELHALLAEFLSIFALSDSELGQTSLWTHKIELVDKTPVRLPERPLPYALREKVAGMIRDYLERKVISPSNSSYSSPVVLVRKRGDDQLRFCVDYRILNSRTSKFAGPLPNIDYMLLTMGPKKYFTSLDMLSAYWQICLDEESKPLTAFPALGSLYHFNVLSFGLTNAPGTFQQFMQRVFDGIVNDYVYIFLDDLLVVSSTWQEHISHLREVFTRLRDAQLKLKPKKCRLAASQVKYLGHILSPEGLKMDPEKVAPMSDFPRPKHVREIQSFRGLVGHYRKFIKGFALICRPLDELTKKCVEFKWTPSQEGAFVELKRLVCEEVTLQFPDFKAAKEDPQRPLVLQTDACKEGVAGILCQRDERGALRPIHFVSRTTKHAEKNYGVTELEALSVKYCFTKLAPYLIGLPVVVETDHSALVSMFTKPKECGNSRIDKWAMQLMSRFDFKVVYKPGKANVAADALSRSVAAQGIIVVAVTTRRMARENAENRTERLPPINEAEENSLRAEPLTADSGFEDETFVEPEEEKSWTECLASGELADVYAFLGTRELPKCPDAMQVTLRKAENFALVEGKLHYIEPETAELRLFVPEQFRRKLFDERHSGTYAAHACGAKIFGMIKKQCWWPGMRSDCEKWARSCKVCVFTRKPRNNVPPLQPIESKAPWEILCIDLLQLPLATSGHKYALICVDHFSKYVVTCALFDKTAESIAEALVHKVFLIYGASQRLHSDLGGEFVNKILAELVSTFKMGQTTTAGYNPRCNGLAERMGRQLIKMLSQTVPIPQCWQEKLDFVTFAYNISPQQETGESPYYLIFSRDVYFPSEVTEALVFSPYAVDLDDFRSIMLQNIGNAVQNVQAALDKSRQRAKAYYDVRNRSKAHKYRVGQRVMVYDPSVPNTVANKLSWRYFGPFRVTEIANNNAKVYPIDKPHSEPQLVPLDRLCPIPAEVPHIAYARKPNRSKIMTACLSVQNCPLLVTTVELNVATVREEIPLHPFAESEEKDRFVSKEKDVVLFTAYEANGLGPFYECGGPNNCSANCSDVLLSDIVSSLPDSTVKSAKVPTLGHQIYLAALSRRYDGTDLEEKVKAVLKCPAAELAKSFGSICAGADVPEITHEVILSQARIRHLRCDRVSASLIQSAGLPLKMVGATAADHPLFSELTFAKSRLIHAGVGDNFMGEVWEEVRHGAGKPLVTNPFVALAPLGDKALVRGQHMTVEDTADLLAANFYLQQHAFSGAVQLIILVLPPTTPQSSARLDALLATVRSYGHVQLVVLPPPPSAEPSHRAVVMKLLALPDQPHLRATDVGRSIFEIGFFGRIPDRRFVDVQSGKWSDLGRALLRQHLLEVSALRPLKFYQRPGPPPPPQPTVRSQVFRVPPPPQRSARQDDSRKRAYQPQQQQSSKPTYYGKQQRKQ